MYRAPLPKILSLAKDFVSTPSQCRIDNQDNIYHIVIEFLHSNGVKAHKLEAEDGRILGIYARHVFSSGDKGICLNACLDTAPIGSLRNWDFSPFSASIQDNYLLGRGAADSKMGAAIFSNLFVELVKRNDLKGTLHLYLDLDEHAGSFEGIKKFVQKSEQNIDFVFIGYPGNTQICTGARGIHRIDLTIFGASGHTGSSQPSGINAIERAVDFIAMLKNRDHISLEKKWYGMLPKITVTGIQGGQSFSVVPDTCKISIDCRTTIYNDAAWIDSIIAKVLREAELVDESMFRIDIISSFPAYDARESQFVHLINDQAKKIFGRQIDNRVAGPSNIGNALAALGIPSTCGFGVAGVGVHAPNEKASVQDIDKVYRVYKNAVVLSLVSNLNLIEKTVN